MRITVCFAADVKIIYNPDASAVGSSHEEFRKYLLADMDKWKKAVAASGAKANWTRP